MWRALLVVVSLSLATSARADTTYIDRGIDRLGVLTFDALNDRQDYDGLIGLANSLLATPAFFDGKPMLADVVARIVMISWRRHGYSEQVGPFLPDKYRERANAMLQVAAIHPSFGDEPLTDALDTLYYIRDLDRAYDAMRMLEDEFPHSQRARWAIRRRIDLHARHGEFATAAVIARQFIETARRPEQREAFYVASDAMPIWLGLGNVATAVHMLDFMSRQARADAVSNADMYLMDAAILVDDHRLAALDH